MAARLFGVNCSLAAFVPYDGRCARVPFIIYLRLCHYLGTCSGHKYCMFVCLCAHTITDGETPLALFLSGGEWGLTLNIFRVPNICLNA